MRVLVRTVKAALASGQGRRREMLVASTRGKVQRPEPETALLVQAVGMP